MDSGKSGIDLVRLFLGFDVDRAFAQILRLVATYVGFLHAFLEPLHRTAKILADVAQLLGAKDQYDDDQYDQPVPDAE